MKKLHGCMVIFAFVVALGFTGCEEAGLSTPGPEVPPGSNPGLYETLWYVSSEGGDDDSGTTPEEPFAAIGAALTAIQAAYDADDPAWTNKTAGIVILEDMTIAPVAPISGNYPPLFLMGKAPDADGPAKGLQLASIGSLITVGDGVSLTLGDITLTGIAANTVALVTITDGGHLILEEGAVITGNTSSGGYTGGGVAMSSNSGSASFTMNGGEICGNVTNGGGGGVLLDAGDNEWSSFTMKGGTISDNSAHGSQGGGGVVAYDKVKIEITGGFIIDNEATGSQSMGGGVYLERKGTFIMEGGTISGNTAVAGGGVAIGQTASFTKTGGTIYGSPDDNQNTATSTYAGHAVYVSPYSACNSTTGPDDKRSYDADSGTTTGEWVW